MNCTADNDEKKVKAIINEIHGRTHDGSPDGHTPTLFGMNFQAVSVGQKLSKNNSDGSCPKTSGLDGEAGGYVDGAGTPTKVLAYGLDKTDEALGGMIRALKRQGIYESTLFIVSAMANRRLTRPRSTSRATSPIWWRLCPMLRATRQR